MAAVRRSVRGVHTGADDRRLMAHRVDTVEQRSDRACVPDVDQLHALRRLGAVTVGGGQHRIDRHDLVTRIGERGRHP